MQNSLEQQIDQNQQEIKFYIQDMKTQIVQEVVTEVKDFIQQQFKEIKQEIKEISNNKQFQEQKQLQQIQSPKLKEQISDKKKSSNSQKDTQINEEQNSLHFFDLLNTQINQQQQDLNQEEFLFQNINNYHDGDDEEEEQKSNENEENEQIYELGKCKACFEEGTLLVIFHKNCKHAQYCFDCFQTYIGQYLSLSQLSIQCENKDCEWELDFDFHIKKQLLSQESIDKYIQVCTNQSEIICSNCNKINIVDIDAKNNYNYINCQHNCGNKICLKCLKTYENDEHECVQFDIESFLTILNTQKEERIRLCPKCYQVYLKDENCEHVKCLKCKFEFCFSCLCDRNQTLNHSNRYHRRDCKFYSNSDLNLEKQQDNCIQCQKKGDLCQPPEQSYEEFLKFIQKKLKIPEHRNLKDECTIKRTSLK